MPRFRKHCLCGEGRGRRKSHTWQEGGRGEGGVVGVEGGGVGRKGGVKIIVMLSGKGTRNKWAGGVVAHMAR